MTPQGTIQGYLSRLRYPQLFVVAGVLFLIDLAVPDLVPFIDEALLAIGTILLGSLEKRRETTVDKPPIKDVTPGD